MIKQDTSMPDVNFGQANQSIVTGKAINELQGAGTGTLVEMVQGVSIGKALSSWNEKAIEIGRNLFKDETIRLFGNEVGSLAEINPRSFAMNIKGSQLVGSPRNEVVFMPYLDMQQKVVIGLQLAGAGLVSKQWQRENVGIPDSEAMDEEIVGETIQDAVLALIVQSITDPEAGAAAQEQAIDVIEGGHTTHPLVNLQPPPIAPDQAASSGLPIAAIPGGPGQVEAPPMKLPPGAPVPTGPVGGGGAVTPGPQAGQPVLLDDAIQQFHALQGVTGSIYLVGEIVQTGQTADTVNVDITADADRDVIARGVQFPVQIKVVSGPPNEPYIDVSPGSTNTAIQGEMPSPDEALAG
jgi:hypothetical protein